MNKVKSGDVSIHYRRLGNDRGLTPILIVHGLSYFSYDWLGVGESLGAEREVILMDMRGFGDSDWSPTRDYSVPTMAQDIVAVLEHAGWKQAVLIGHSMGGRSTRRASPRSRSSTTRRRTRPPVRSAPPRWFSACRRASARSRKPWGTSAARTARASRPTPGRRKAAASS